MVGRALFQSGAALCCTCPTAACYWLKTSQVTHQPRPTTQPRLFRNLLLLPLLLLLLLLLPLVWKSLRWA